MIIEINPKLTALLTNLAQGQGMADEAYVAHVIEKYLVGQERQATISLITTLDIDELKQTKTEMIAKLEARPNAETPEETGITP